MNEREHVGLHAKEEMHHIRLAFGSVLQLMDSDDNGSAALVADKLMKRLAALIEAIRKSSEVNKAYINVVIANHVPEFEEDLAFLSSLAKTAAAPMDVKEFRKTIRRLEGSIAAMNREVRILFPHQFGVRRFFQEKWKRYRLFIIVGSLSILIVSVLFFPWYVHDLKKHSLVAEYFDDMDLNHLYKKRYDRNVDFSWGYGSPFLGFKIDQFSVRWTGYLKAEKAGTYQFQTESDDGVIVWIDDKKIIDDWNTHSLQKNTGSLYLTEGYHPIKVHYYEFNANAEIRLLWKIESEADFTVVPPSAFVSSAKYLPS